MSPWCSDMVAHIIRAVRPWDSADSYDRKLDFSTYDEQWQIEMCLSCPIADECLDCVARREKMPWWKKVFGNG